jgi:hypothetical protein
MTPDITTYTAGVDRSATEVAALFLADFPDGDPVAFLVDAAGLTGAEAAAAVALIDAPAPKRGRKPTDTEA